jgi:hypothetical protein
MRRLTPEELRAVCDPASLPFHSTEELDERAFAAVVGRA